MSYLVPYLGSSGSLGKQERSDAGDDFATKVLSFLRKGGALGLQLKKRDETVTRLSELRTTDVLDEISSVVRQGEVSETSSELSALAVLRASATSVILAEALDYILLARESTELDSRYLGTVCTKLEDLVRLNDEIWMEETRTLLPGTATTSSDRNGTAPERFVGRDGASTSSSSVFSGTRYKQNSASEYAFMSFLLNIRVEEIFCLLATEVVNKCNDAEEDMATAAIRLSIRFLLMGAEVAVESKTRGKRTSEEERSIMEFTSKCLVSLGQKVGRLCAKYPAIDMESWLIAAEDFCEGCKFGIANVCVSLFCGMTDALEVYFSSDPIPAACKRSLLLLLRLVGPVDDTRGRFRKPSRSRSLQSPEQLASQLIGTERARISLDDVSEAARNIFPTPLKLSSTREISSELLPLHPTVEQVLRTCERFLQVKSQSSEESSSTLLRLLSTVMETAASRAEERAPPSSCTAVEASETEESGAQMFGDTFDDSFFLATSELSGSGSKSTSSSLKPVHLEIVNLSIQILTVLIDFVPREATRGLYEFYASTMRTARLLPLENLPQPQGSVLSSRLRTLLLSAPRGQHNPDLMSQCHASVLNAFIEDGLGGLKDPLGARHESFFVAYFVLKSEQEMRLTQNRGSSDFVTTLLLGFSNELEKVVENKKNQTITYATLLLIAYAFSALQLPAQRRVFVGRLSAVVDRAVKVLHDTSNRDNELRAMLNLLNILDYCTSFFSYDGVPIFLKSEIENEVFQSSVRGEDGAEQFQLLMTSHEKSDAEERLVSAIGPTSSCLETLLDILWARVWDMRIGASYERDDTETISNFTEVCWRILERLPPGSSSSVPEVHGGLSGRLNNLRTRTIQLNSALLADVAAESLGKDVQSKDCIWVTANALSLIKGADSAEGRPLANSEAVIKILATLESLVGRYPNAWKSDNRILRKRRRSTRMTFHESCLMALSSGVRDMGYSSLQMTTLILIEAATCVAGDLHGEQVISDSAALAAKVGQDSEVHELLVILAKRAWKGSEVEKDEAIPIIFLSHRMATVARLCVESPSGTQSWLQFLEDSGRSPELAAVEARATMLVFGGGEDDVLGTLVPRWSLKDTLLKVAESEADQDGARMLGALRRLMTTSTTGAGWKAAVRQTVIDVARDDAVFPRIMSKVLAHRTGAECMVSIFESIGNLDTENVDLIFKLLRQGALDPSASSVSLLYTIDIMLVIAAGNGNERFVPKLVVTYFELLQRLWDDRSFRPLVLDAALKSCVLIQRICRIYAALGLKDTSATETSAASVEGIDQNQEKTTALDSEVVELGDADEDGDASTTDEEEEDEYSFTALASQCCTFTETGRQFVEQHWYYCYTCGMTCGEGICRVCALVCHRDHEISYSRSSRFFCDCGAGGSDANNPSSRAGTSFSQCLALHPRHEVRTNEGGASGRPRSASHDNSSSDESMSHEQRSVLLKDCETVWSDDDTTKSRIAMLLHEVLDSTVLVESIRDVFLNDENTKSVMVAARGSHGFSEGRLFDAALMELLWTLRNPRVVEARKDVAEPRISTRASTVSFKKSDMGGSHRQHKLHFNMIAYCGSGAFVTVDRAGKVLLSDIRLILGESDVNADASGVKATAQNTVPSGPSRIEANEENPRYLLLSYSDKVMFLEVYEQAEFQNCTAVTLGKTYLTAGQQETKELGATWVKGYQSLAAVSHGAELSMFDLSVSVVAPCRVLRLENSDDEIIGSSLMRLPSSGKLGITADFQEDRIQVVCITRNGLLYSCLTSLVDEQDNVLRCDRNFQKVAKGKPISVCLSKWLLSVVVVLDNGSVLFRRVGYQAIGDCEMMLFESVFPALEQAVVVDSLDAPNFFLCTAKAANDSVHVKLLRNSNGCLHHQNIGEQVPKVLSKIFGAVFCEAANDGYPERPTVAILSEDGSVNTFALMSEDGVSLPARPRYSDAQGPGNENKLEHAPCAVGFFEKCRQIKDQITLGGDILDCDGGLSAEEARRAVRGSGTECVVSPTPNAVFKIRISTRNRSYIITGIRMLLGSCERSRSRVPARVNVFGRCAATIVQSARRWVDIPLNVFESAASPRDVTVELVPQSSNVSDGTCAFDALEVYGVNVSEFSEMKSKHEKRMRKLQRKRSKQQEKARHKQQMENLVRNTALQKRCFLEETLALSGMPLAKLNDNALEEFLVFMVELSQMPESSYVVRKECKAILEKQYRKEGSELATLMREVLLKRLRSRGIRLMENEVNAPREIEEMLLATGRIIDDDAEQFGTFLASTNILEYCRTLAVLHQSVQDSGIRAVHHKRDITVSLLRIYYTIFRTSSDPDEKQALASLLFALLTNDSEDVRNISSKHMFQVVMESMQQLSGTDHDVKEEIKLITFFIHELLAAIDSTSAKRYRAKGIILFDVMNFLQKLVTGSEECAALITDELVRLRECLANKVAVVQIWQNEDQAMFEKSFLLLRLIAVMAKGTESNNESNRRSLLWSRELFEGLARLLENLWPLVEERFSIGNLAKQQETDEEDEDSVQSISPFRSTTSMDPLISPEVLNQVFRTRGNRKSSRSALLTAETALEVLQSLWSIRDEVSDECISDLRRITCLYAYLAKDKLPNLGMLWVATLKATSRSAKNLLHLLCNLDRGQYYSELDRFFYQQRLKKVSVALKKAEGDSQETSYDDQVELGESLSGMLGLARKRPWNWREFCKTKELGTEGATWVLLKVASSFGDPLLLYSIRLLAAAFANTNEDAKKMLLESNLPDIDDDQVTESELDSESPVDFETWIEDSNYRLNMLVRNYCLGSASQDVRVAATEIVRGLLLSSKESNVEFYGEIKELILRFIPAMGSEGHQCEEFASLVSFCSKIASDDEDYCKRVAKSVSESMIRGLNFLKNHPNCYLYKHLDSVLELNGFFLESDVCAICALGIGDRSPASSKLDICSERKYTDRAILCLLRSQRAISSISLKVVHTGRSCRVRTINVLYSCRPVDQASELNAASHPWRMSKAITLGLRQTEAKLTFSIPIVAENLMFEFAELHATDGDGASSSERLLCPRCSRTVSDRHGICRNCDENAYQCRQCRNINYENLDAFLCIECGYCKHGKFEFTLESAISFSAERIVNEADRLRTTSIIENEITFVQTQYDNLCVLGETVRNLINDTVEDESIYDNAPDVEQLTDIERGTIDISELESPLPTILRRIARAEGDDDGAVAFLDRSFAAAMTGSRANSGSDILSRPGASSVQAVSSKINQKTAILASVYGKECAKAYVALSRTIQGLTAIRKELLRYTVGKVPVDFVVGAEEDGINCFGCAAFFVMRSSELVSDLLTNVGVTKPTLAESGLVEAISENEDVLDLSRASASTCRKIVATIAVSSEALMDRLTDRLSLKLEACTSIFTEVDVGSLLAADLNTFEAIGSLAGNYWEMLFKDKLLKYFLKAGDMNSASLAEHVVLPALRILRNVARREYRAQSPLTQLLADEKFRVWVMKVALKSPCSDVRGESIDILETLHEGDNQKAELISSLSDQLRSMRTGTGTGEDASEFFDWFARVLGDADVNSIPRVVRSVLLPNISSQIAAEAEALQKTESRLDRFSFSQGYALRRLAELMKITLRGMSAKNFSEVRSKELISSLLQAYLTIRKLVVQRTELTDECSESLLAVLRLMDSLDDKKDVVRAFVRESILSYNATDARSLSILLEQLREMLCPHKAEPVYEIIFTKSPTQEEFIRGNLSRGAYPSTSIGLVMRDVKNKICRDLELTGLLEDDFGLELLVAGKLLTLDLSIRSVYNHIWRPSQRQSQEAEQADTEVDTPMVVVYRLSGLDGQATEPIVDSLEEPEDEKIDPEIEFAETSIVAETGGLDLLLKLILEVENLSIWKENVRSTALELLQASCKIRSNRLSLAKRDILSKLLEFSAAAFWARDKAATHSAEILLSMSASILAEYESEMSSSSDEIERTKLLHDEDVMYLVKVFLDQLDQSSSLAEAALLEVIPFICRGVEPAQKMLIEYFLTRLTLSELDSSESTQTVLKRLSSMLNASSRHEDEFVRLSLMEKGLADESEEYLSSHFPLPRKDNLASWEHSLILSGPALVLRLLQGLARMPRACGDFYKGRIVEYLLPMIPTLTTLETVSSASAIGAVAEELLDEVMVLPKIETEVKKFRKEIKDARRAAAAARRREILEEAGVVSAGEGGSVVSSSQHQLSASNVPKCIEMEGIEEEKGPICLVCRDGFQSKPDEILGLYVFCKRVAVSERKAEEEDTTDVSSLSSADYQMNFFYTTVTHLNAIHYSCHRESVRLDRSSSRPRDEWEGSALRNSQTKCNNLFPLEPPTLVAGAVPNVQPGIAKISRRGYSDAIDQYFFRNHTLGHSGLTQLQLLLHDLGSSLLRFGAGDMTAFSRDTQGGGAHSNASLIPYFMQLGLHLESSHEDEVVAMTDSLRGFLETGGDEIAYYLSFSICLLSVEDWLEKAPTFLRHAQKELGKEKALATVAFVHMVQRFFKHDLGENWKRDFRQQLAQGMCYSDRVQELVQFYEGHKVYDNESFLKAIESSQTDREESMGFLEALRSVLTIVH